jgi:DNA polymerase (family X)
MMPDSLNATIAERLDEVALLLEQQESNPFRVAAYRNGSNTLRQLDRSVRDILEADGIDGLMKLPAIGEKLARAIRMIVTTGRLPLLEQLRGESDPELVFATLPGVGPTLARRIHLELGIDSLEDLEAAAADGRLAKLDGIGKKRLAGIRDVLARRLGRVQRSGSTRQPPVADLLDVDREYRARASAGTLRRIAPRRFNPTGEAWLPVLHTRRGLCEYTALFSNTARAHELQMTDDWVVIYCDDGNRELSYTVVTGTRGPLQGLRVVRGREEEVVAHYRESGAAS